MVHLVVISSNHCRYVDHLDSLVTKKKRRIGLASDFLDDGFFLCRTTRSSSAPVNTVDKNNTSLLSFQAIWLT
jgi:hypothetical protein